MGKVLIIGAGGVATVAAHKVAQNSDVFSEIMIASRTKSKCDAIVKAIGRDDIKTAQVDADSVEQLCELFRSFQPDPAVSGPHHHGGLPAVRLLLPRHGQL